MRKNNDVFVDYKLLKTCVSIIMVLDHYGWVRELKGTGNTVRSCCPIHNGSNDKQFVVNIRNNTWCCFGDCRKGGSILELVAEIEKIDNPGSGGADRVLVSPFPSAQSHKEYCHE